MEEPESCVGAGGIAIAIVGTFITTCLVLAVAGLLYRQWRRNKGKHLVLVTDPEIVEEAYAFDNPCFKDCTPAGGRSLERPISLVSQQSETKDQQRWSSPWSHLGRADKRRTLDDSSLEPKAKTVNVVALRSRDFTGLGFNVCGNMREGIFVKDLLHRGPASESGRIHPGDRISSVKISFRSMVYEDALTILSYASPYDVELEVESGGESNSKPASLLKRSVGPSAPHLYHPLYRSHSIPDLNSQTGQQHSHPQQQSSAGRRHGAPKRLFEPNDSSYSNYSTLNSTLKSSKSTPTAASQSLERRSDSNQQQPQQPKFGIKVLPALDGTIHRIETQNEHNTNLERRHSKKLEKKGSSNGAGPARDGVKLNGERLANENLQQRNASTPSLESRAKASDGVDQLDRGTESVKKSPVKERSMIPSQVPAEVHNAAMAARRNRPKSSSAELLQQQQQQLSSDQSESEPAEVKSPQKGKRKAPAPPSRSNSSDSGNETKMTINGIGDYREPEPMPADKTMAKEPRKQAGRRNSESDTDSEIQTSFTTIELNSSDITVHHSPVPEAGRTVVAVDEEDDADSVYRKAASLGDLSKYESRAASSTLERAQSLDMTAETAGTKKRKAPIPPAEDIHESTEDLTKLDQMDCSFEVGFKLRKSSEWGTLEDAIWSGQADEIGSSSIEQSMSDTEPKSKDAEASETASKSDGLSEAGLELYNLPLTKQMTRDFIRTERMFDPDEDNALARIVNDGEVVKSPSAEQTELEFTKAHPVEDMEDKPNEEEEELELELESTPSPGGSDEGFERAVRYFETHATGSSPLTTSKVNIPERPEELYAGKEEVKEEMVSKQKKSFRCPGCERGHERHRDDCSEKPADQTPYRQTIRLEEPKDDAKSSKLDSFETHFAKPIINIPELEPSAREKHLTTDVKKKDVHDETEEEEEEDDDVAAYEFGGGSGPRGANLSPSPGVEKRNVSSVSVSSGENSEDSGLVRESLGAGGSRQRPAYVTEIKVSTPAAASEEEEDEEKRTSKDEEEAMSDNEEIMSIMGKRPVLSANGKLPAGKKPPVPPRRSDATRYVTSRGDSANPERQVIYVSEYKGPPRDEKPQSETNTPSYAAVVGRRLEAWPPPAKDDDTEMEINPWASQPSEGTSQIFGSPLRK